jgi:phosphate transport system substrate-binding protein
MPRGIAACALALSASLCGVNGHAAEAHPARGNASAQGKLVISGSSAMAPLMTAIARRFVLANPGVRIDVLTVGTGQGIDDVRQGKADIGMASRAMRDNESDLFSYAIARDGVCLIVHKDNPVRGLTNVQVLEIYTGKIDNWSKVGGKDARITPINSMKAVGTVELFTQYFGIRYADIKAASPPLTYAERLKAVTRNPNAIAYMSVGAAQRELEAGVPIKLLPIDGVAATTKNIRTGDFPVSRPLLLITHALPRGLARDFISFSLSSQITDLVAQHEFVPYLD